MKVLSLFFSIFFLFAWTFKPDFQSGQLIGNTQLPNGIYELELREGDNVDLIKVKLKLSSANILEIKSIDPMFDLTLRAFMDGTLFMAYAPDYNEGMMLRGTIGDKNIDGDGVWEQVSESPVYIRFSMRWHSEQKQDEKPEIRVEKEMGEMTDPRDGQKYETVRLGTQIWMAQNLNFKTEKGSIGNEKADASANGLYYNHPTAMSACPEGWHLPTDAEWAELIKFLGGSSKATALLKSEKGWKDNGNNASGFNAPAAGFFSPNTRSFAFFGEEACFWTATDYFAQEAYLFSIKSNTSKVEKLAKEKTQANSCRCIKD